MAEASSGVPTGYQDIFSAFFVGASEADAHYYSIKEVGDNTPSLARLLDVSQDILTKLLVVSGFGGLRECGKFVFVKNKFDQFITKHALEGVCKLVQRKPKGFGNQLLFVKVGAKLWADAATPGTKGVGPRIRNIRLLRKSFKDKVYRISAVLNNQPVESSEHKSADEGNDRDESEEACNEYENSLILLRIKTKLL